MPYPNGQRPFRALILKIVSFFHGWSKALKGRYLLV